MRLIFITLLALALATAVGLGSTYMTATRGTDLGTLTIGAWTARPKSGTAEVDPYSRASIARTMRSIPATWPFDTNTGTFEDRCGRVLMNFAQKSASPTSRSRASHSAPRSSVMQ